MFVCTGDLKATGVHKSTDAGRTWKRLLDMGERTGWPEALVIVPKKPYPIYVASQDHAYHDESSGTGLWRSADEGKTWTQCNDGLKTLHFWNITLDPNLPYRIFPCGNGSGAYVGIDPLFR